MKPFRIDAEMFLTKEKSLCFRRPGRESGKGD